MSWTLLDYTQAILSSMDSDEVNSISDTVESTQVLRILKTVWEEIIAKADLDEHWTLFELEPSLDPTKPTLMYRPSDVHSLEWIKYNCKLEASDPDAFRVIPFVPLDQFLERMYSLNTDDDNVGTFDETIGTSTITFMYVNNSSPNCWTTFDDHTIIFNSYDVSIDSTLQKTKTLAYGKKQQEWVEEDNFVPFLDSEYCVLFLNEAKSLAFQELKQMPHERAERSSRKLWSGLQKKKRGLDRNRSELDRLPNYAR